MYCDDGYVERSVCSLCSTAGKEAASGEENPDSDSNSTISSQVTSQLPHVNTTGVHSWSSDSWCTPLCPSRTSGRRRSTTAGRTGPSRTRGYRSSSASWTVRAVGTAAAAARPGAATHTHLRVRKAPSRAISTARRHFPRSCTQPKDLLQTLHPSATRPPKVVISL